MLAEVPDQPLISHVFRACLWSWMLLYLDLRKSKFQKCSFCITEDQIFYVLDIIILSRNILFSFVYVTVMV